MWQKQFHYKYLLCTLMEKTYNSNVCCLIRKCFVHNEICSNQIREHHLLSSWSKFPKFFLHLNEFYFKISQVVSQSHWILFQIFQIVSPSPWVLFLSQCCFSISLKSISNFPKLFPDLIKLYFKLFKVVSRSHWVLFQSHNQSIERPSGCLTRTGMVPSQQTSWSPLWRI